VYLVNQILRHHNVVGIVVEAPPPALSKEEKNQRRRRLVRKYGLVRTLNKLALNWTKSRLLARKNDNEMRDLLFPSSSVVQYERDVQTITVPNVNAEECVRFVESARPDVIAVCGTTVIKEAVFSLPPLGAINIHTGITPEYRSAEPIFWAIYNAEPDKVGVTIHFVDSGIDTGPIIHQQAIPLYRTDSLTSINARCIEVGATLYLRALDEIARGVVRTHRKNVQGKAFYSIDQGIFEYMKFVWKFARLKRRLPVHEPPHVAERGR
jgi:methionyl-tRNA formyltransferase